MDSFDYLEFESEAQARPAAKAAPNPKSAYQAARAMRESGRFLEAALLYQRLVGVEDHDYQSRVELVDCLIRGGKGEEALKIATASVNQFRKVRLLYAAKALALAHAKQVQEAFEASELSLGGEPSWYAYCVRAELLLRFTSAWDGEAKSYIAKAIALEGMAWEPHFLAGTMLLNAQLPALAAGYFSEAIHAAPRAAASWLGLAKAFEAARLYDQALFYYQKLQEFDPGSNEAITGQRRCAPRRFGLISLFELKDLRKRWNKCIQKDLQR